MNLINNYRFGRNNITKIIRNESEKIKGKTYLRVIKTPKNIHIVFCSETTIISGKILAVILVSFK